MKKIISLFLLAILLVIPFSVFAEGEEVTSAGGEKVTTTAEEDNKVPVYLFRGEGCPHCQEAEEWFDSIQGEYGSKFKVVDYETWNDQSNAELMQKVASARGETAEGVPYIIIGNQSWNGFADEYKSEIIAQIESVYEQPKTERYDIIERVTTGKTGEDSKKEESSNDVLALIVILLITGGVCFGVYKARSNAN